MMETNSSVVLRMAVEIWLKCNMCPNRCSWQKHRSMKFYFSTERKQVVKTSEDLKSRYLDATGKVKTEVLRVSINNLNRIALKPTNIFTGQYIQILIESERSSGEPGWADRVEHLSHVKEKADNLAAVAAQGFDPFLEYKRKIQEERESKQGVWCAVGNYLQKIKYWSV